MCMCMPVSKDATIVQNQFDTITCRPYDLNGSNETSGEQKKFRIESWESITELFWKELTIKVLQAAITVAGT